MIKIFYNNKILIISENNLNENNITKIDFSDNKNIKNLINKFLDEKGQCILNLFGEKEGIILDEISVFFKLVKAGGGIVRKLDSLLFINRLGVWDLPKGKIEADETNEDGAIREVCEECGISESDLILERFIQKTYHVYNIDQQYMLKETSWFEMYFSGHYELVPQREENITSVEWIKINEINSVLKNIYPSIKMLINYYLSHFRQF